MRSVDWHGFLIIRSAQLPASFLPLCFSEFTTLSLGDSNSDRDSDTLGPLPTHSGGLPPHWNPPLPGDSDPNCIAYTRYTPDHQAPKPNFGTTFNTPLRSSGSIHEYTASPVHTGIANVHSDVDSKFCCNFYFIVI